MAIPYARVFVVFVNSVYAVRILYKYTNEVTISWLKSPINKIYDICFAIACIYCSLYSLYVYLDISKPARNRNELKIYI